MMIFKRGVFESRRKNKAVFRPKIRINLREVQTVSLNISSLFKTLFAVYLYYAPVSFKPSHSLNSAPSSLPQWVNREKSVFLVCT